MDVKKELDTVVQYLGGTLSEYSTLDSMGRSSKKIVIEYDIKQKDSADN